MYETLPGWDEPLDGCSSVDDLPAAARRYVDFVERALDVEVTLVGTGAERDERPHARVARVAHARPRRVNAPAGSPT